MALPIAMALVALAAFGAGIAAADDVPGEPIAFHGEATDDDETPAPAGTAIVAAVDGTEVDQITVVEAGIYAGDGPTDDKLRTHTEAGETVTFHVGDADGPQAEQIHTVTGDDGLGEPGVFELDLGFPAGTFEDDSDDGDDAPDDDDSDDSDDSDDGDTPDEDDPVDDDPVDEGDEEYPGDDAEPPTITDDPDAIRDQIDLPAEVTPTRSERAGLVADEVAGGSIATFSEESSVESVRFGDDVEGDVTVTELDPDDGADAPGASVATVDIAVPPGSESSPATVRSRVTSDRLAAIGADPDELRIHRLVDGKWEALETVSIEETDTGVVVEAETPGFSLFAVSAVGTPVAAAELPAEVIVGEEILLDAEPSSDRHGAIVSYQWTVDDEVLTGETVVLTLEEAGEHPVELLVTNDANETDTLTATVTANEAGGADEASPGLFGGSALLIGSVVVVIVLAVLVGMRLRQRK